MPAQNKIETLVIDRLWQGESGNAPWQRRVGQVDLGENVRFDFTASEAVKRNAGELVADLDVDSSTPLDPYSDYFWFAIRGAIIAISDSDVYGWDENGNELTVTDETGGAFGTYLPSDPINDLDVAVSYDTAIVCNRTVQPLTENAWTFQQSANFLENGDPDDAASFTADDQDGTVDTFDELPGQGGAGDSSMVAPANGDVWRVRQDFELIPAGRYIYYDGAVHADADGFFDEISNWHRIPSSGASQGKFDDTTMPHRIVYDEGAGTITLQVPPWKQRVSGTATTNVRMPFVRGLIKAVEFNQGRLFFMAEDAVTASREGDFFNLWVNNINAVADNDRIATNITQSSAGVILRTAVCGDNLLIITENAQIQFTSGEEPLTNINGRPHQLTDFQAQDIVPGSGANVAYLCDEFGDVHQYRWLGARAGIVYTGLLTAHKRDVLYGFTPRRIHVIGETIFITNDDDDMVVHESFIIGDEIVQSAWGKMDFLDDPVFVNAWAGEIRIITKSVDAYSLIHYQHRQVAPPDDLEFLPRLNRLELVQPSEMSYDENTNETTMVHTGKPGDMDLSMVVTTTVEGEKVGDVGGLGSDRLRFIPAKRINDDDNPVFPGDLTVDPQYLGFTFDTILRLSKLYPAITRYELQMKTMAVFHRETTDYSVAYVKRDGETVTRRWQAHKIAQSVIGEPKVETHYLEVALEGVTSQTSITLSSSSPGPVAWSAIAVELQAAGSGAFA